MSDNSKWEEDDRTDFSASNACAVDGDSLDFLPRLNTGMLIWRASKRVKCAGLIVSILLMERLFRPTTLTSESRYTWCCGGRTLLPNRSVRTRVVSWSGAGRAHTRRSGSRLPPCYRPSFLLPDRYGPAGAAGTGRLIVHPAELVIVDLGPGGLSPAVYYFRGRDSLPMSSRSHHLFSTSFSVDRYFWITGRPTKC